MGEDKKLLKLSTLVPERPKVEIDGTLYHLKAPTDLSLRDEAWLRVSQGRLDEIREAYEKGDVDEDTAAEMESLITEGVGRLTYDLPDEVLRKLTIGQQIEVLGFFMESTERHVPKPKRSRSAKAATGAK
jgi:hypothetical protein